MKDRFKAFLTKTSPDLYHALRSYRFFLYCRKRFSVFQDAFAEKVYKDGKIAVLAGPFRGMLYFNKIVWGPITPKWIGSYERELHSTVEEIIDVGYDRILDVGAAEGYYAIGLSRRCPRTQVFSFDVDPIARNRQRHLALLNSTDNLSIGKYCSPQRLRESLNSRSLLFCDIEGFEYALLDPEYVPELRHTDILVEIHGYSSLNASEVKESLESRFSQSHDLMAIPTEERVTSHWSSLPQLQGMEEPMLTEALKEHRNGPQEWLWLRAETGGALHIR